MTERCSKTIREELLWRSVEDESTTRAYSAASNVHRHYKIVERMPAVHPPIETTKHKWKRQRIKAMCCSLILLIGMITGANALMLSPRPIQFTKSRLKTASFATMAASKANDSLTFPSGEASALDNDNNAPSTNSKTPIPFDIWLDRTTARLLNLPPPEKTTTYPRSNSDSNPHSPLSQYTTSSPGYIPLGELTVDDVQLITTLMTSHARRGTIESALTCERLLKRVVEEVNAGNTGVRVTTKMYTVAMDAWAKSQRRPLPGTIHYGKNSDGSEPEKKKEWKQTQLQLHPQQQMEQEQQHNNNNNKKQQQIPLGAAAQRAHRIHNSLVQAYRYTLDPHLAPSTVSYNAAINAWSKSYHPSAGEMAELLLGEMMREWRFGESHPDFDDDEDDTLEDWEDDDDYEEQPPKGNTRVRPDVVTFTAVIDAWVKCTALAHDYHYEQPPLNPEYYSSNSTVTKFRKEKENYAEWKRNQAAKADELTRRAAGRAKQLLELMIQLSHYDPLSSYECEPGMRPNCYTYSAVMNALAKSCSALRAVSPSGAVEKGVIYDPAKEAQDMLESMIEKYNRYKERVGEPETWKSVGYNKRFDDNDSSNDSEVDVAESEAEKEKNNVEYNSWLESSWENSNPIELEEKLPSPNNVDPHWFDPRPDEITFPPNTINYNSILNSWSRASRYDSQSALRAEQILLERMERPPSKGGDAVEPDALSYSLVIHAWLRGCRGFNGINGAPSRSNGKVTSQIKFSDEERIQRAIKIVDRMEAWARNNHQSRWKDDEDDRDIENEGDEGYNDGIIDELDTEDETEDDDTLEDADGTSPDKEYARSSPSFRVHNKSRHLDVEVYNSILVAYLREQTGDHAADVMRILDRMEAIAEELDMPSIKPNQRSFNVALDVISKSASRANTSLTTYYDEVEPPKIIGKSSYNPLYAGRAAESLLSRMLAANFRPDAYSFASVLNTYQRIPNGRLEAALAADGVVRGMESLHLHGRIDDPPDVFHYTMVCACWSRSGEQGVAGERCSEILRHMHDRDKLGFARTRPNIRTYNAVIDAHAHNGRLLDAEDMLRSMVDAYESSANRAIQGIEDEEIPVRPDSFSFNTIIQQWARSRSPDGGKRAEAILDLMLEFHHNGNSDVRPDDRSFAYIIHHYTKGSGRMAPDAPDKALAILRKMIKMYMQGYKEVIPSTSNRTNPIFAFTSVIDAHSVLRRADAGIVGDELLGEMTKLGRQIEPLRPNTYTYLSCLYAWSSCGTSQAGDRATQLLERMEHDMEVAAKEGRESIMRTTQRCYILAQTAWARSPSEKKAEGALKILEMMEKNYAKGNRDAKPTVQAYSMVINACAFADLVADEEGKQVKASPEIQLRAFHIAEMMMNRLAKQTDGLYPTSMTFGTFIKCCGRLDLPGDLAIAGATRAFGECCRAGLVSDFVLTQMRYALRPEQFLDVLVKNGHNNWDSKGKILSRDGKRMQRVRWNHLPASWRVNVDPR